MPVPLEQLLPFLAGSIFVNIVPGPDMALVMRQVFLGGTRLARSTIWGNMTGIVAHAIALALGLSALLATSAEAYTAVKLAGAAYLVLLGARTLQAARRGEYAAGDGAASPGPRKGVPTLRTAYVQGLVSTILNPKPALFFLFFIPQFVDASRSIGPQIAFYAAVHIGLGIIWMTSYAHLVARAHRTLTRRSARRRLEAATGTVLILLGLRVAIEQR